MNIITKEALEFANEAKTRFEVNPELATYLDKDAGYVALRGGMFDDSMLIYELGNAVGNFVGQLPKQDKVLVDKEDAKKFRNLKSLIVPELRRSERLIQEKDNTAYNKGFAAAMYFVLNRI
jgi:hypothetical protein